MTIYQLTKWLRIDHSPTEHTVAFYASWNDANLEKRSLEFNNSDYEYIIYTRKVIPDSEKMK